MCRRHDIETCATIFLPLFLKRSSNVCRKKHPMSVLAGLLVNPHNTKMGRRSKRRLNIRSQAVEPSSVESETTMWNKVTEILVGLKRFGRWT